MKTPRPKKQPKIKTPKQKKPKKVAVFIKLNELNEEEISNRIQKKYSNEMDFIKSKFEDALNGYIGMIKGKKAGNKPPEKESINDFLRGQLGYSLFTISGAKIGLISQEALDIKKTLKYDQYKNLLTYDHVFGCLGSAHCAIDVFTKRDYDVDYMVNEWFPKNLYRWMVVQVTKIEHSTITSNTNKLTESKNPNYQLEYNFKRKLEHYKGISDIGFLVKE